MAILTLADIKQQIRDACDFQSNYVPDTMLTDFINGSFQELYDILVQKYGARYFLNDPDGYVFQTVPGQSAYSLPQDCYKPFGVDWQFQTGYWHMLRQFNWAERNRNPNSGWSFGFNGRGVNVKYIFNGSNIIFAPTPLQSYTMRLYYVPHLQTLANDGSQDTSSYNQELQAWVQYVITDCCIKCLRRSQEPIDEFLQDKMMLMKRIEDAAANRNLQEPDTVFSMLEASLGEGEIGWF